MSQDEYPYNFSVLPENMDQLKTAHKPTKYFEQLIVDDLHKALNRILSQQFLQVKIERYERNFIWHRLMDELKKVCSVVER